jgi:hypothetical protein
MKGIKESGYESRPAEVEVSGEMDGKGKEKEDDRNAPVSSSIVDLKGISNTC